MHLGPASLGHGALWFCKKPLDQKCLWGSAWLLSLAPCSISDLCKSPYSPSMAQMEIS